MHRLVRVALLLLSVVIFLANAKDSDGVDGPLRSLKQGLVKGKVMTSEGGKPFEAYLGIPFGKVRKRFTSPEAAGAWSGIHDGTKDAPACKQFELFPRNAIHGEEDCLTLNVYTPEKSNTSGPFPVMVFIYGGGFVMGEASSTMYGPEMLMNQPIILVLMNYRLAGFGFLSTGDEAAPGNFGLLDQVLALRWIKDNIAAFGGDPLKVTISGESAGAASVAFHLLSPLSKGMFRGAIAQSGATLCPWSIQENALNITKSVAEKLNCTTNNNAEMVQCLRNVDADHLLRAENEIAGKALNSLAYSFGPVVENANKGGKFLTEEPLKILNEGRFNKVPVISGLDSYESSSSVKALVNLGQLPTPKDITDKNVDTIITNLVSNEQPGKKTDLNAIKEMYFKGLNFNSAADVRLKEVDLSSDFMFRSCNDKTVKLLSKGGIPVYMYVFDYAPKELSYTDISGKPAAYHGIELYFLFDMKFNKVAKNFTEGTKTFRKRVIDLWTNFVIHGNPTPSGPILWEPTPPGAIRYLNITENMAMVDGYYTKEMQFWDDHSHQQ